jgi:hypothetical protein
MKKRIGFVSNSSSSDYIIRSDEDNYDSLPVIDDLIQYGDSNCEHFFISRTDCNEKRKDTYPGICIKCGCFIDLVDLTDEIVEEYDIEFNMDEEISATAFSFFKNPFAEEKFKNGINVKHDINDMIIL